jgi:hypothetical protein
MNLSFLYLQEEKNGHADYYCLVGCFDGFSVTGALCCLRHATSETYFVVRSAVWKAVVAAPKNQDVLLLRQKAFFPTFGRAAMNSCFGNAVT